MRCPQSRPATISCRQTMAMSKPSGGVAAGIGAAGIGAAGGAGERIRLNVPIIDCSRTGKIGKAAEFDSAMRRFESSRPSQAVRSPGFYFPVGENRRHSRGLRGRIPVSGR